MKLPLFDEHLEIRNERFGAHRTVSLLMVPKKQKYKRCSQKKELASYRKTEEISILYVLPFFLYAVHSQERKNRLLKKTGA